MFPSSHKLAGPTAVNGEKWTPVSGCRFSSRSVSVSALVTKSDGCDYHQRDNYCHSDQSQRDNYCQNLCSFFLFLFFCFSFFLFSRVKKNATRLISEPKHTLSLWKWWMWSPSTTGHEELSKSLSYFSNFPFYGSYLITATYNIHLHQSDFFFQLFNLIHVTGMDIYLSFSIG